MKRIIYKLTLGILCVVVLNSCTDNSAELKEGAEMMCNCFNEAKSDSSLLNETLNESIKDLNYATCALNLISKPSINPTSDEFLKAIEENCSDLIEVHKRYIVAFKEATSKE